MRSSSPSPSSTSYSSSLVMQQHQQRSGWILQQQQQKQHQLQHKYLLLLYNGNAIHSFCSLLRKQWQQCQHYYRNGRLSKRRQLQKCHHPICIHNSNNSNNHNPIATIKVRRQQRYYHHHYHHRYYPHSKQQHRYDSSILLLSWIILICFIVTSRNERYCFVYGTFDTMINKSLTAGLYNGNNNNNNNNNNNSIQSQQQQQRRERNEEFHKRLLQLLLHEKRKRRHKETIIQQQNEQQQQQQIKYRQNDIPIIYDPSFIYDIHPTAILSSASERRKMIRSSATLMRNDTMYDTLREEEEYDNNANTTKTNEYYEQWFHPNETSAIYATIPDHQDPKYINDITLQKYYQYRHLSRYEYQYRTQNLYPLQDDTWNGLYDTYFIKYIVQFDNNNHDDYYYTNNNTTTSPIDNNKENSNIEIPQQQQYWNVSLSKTTLQYQPERRQRRRPSNINKTHDDKHFHARKRRTSGTGDGSSSSSSSSTGYIINGGIYNNYQSVPLSQGYGTHFANVWVGTPIPQRKTVIVDTGSHYTAFPCTGCKNCGAPHHTDPYYRPEHSTSFQQLQCNECQDGVTCENSLCKFSQSYTEGSSWEAIQVRDQFYCGGTDVLDSVSPYDQKYSIDFMFGCQIGMTGLFITQLADGIMGMSAHPATLPKKLYDAKKIEHNMFAMCYRRELGTSKRGVTAGSMTLGGVSNNLDTSPFVFAKNVVKVGWFTVYVKNIYIRSGGGQSARSIDPLHQTIKVRLNPKTLNSGKGVIVDSGTTDTYLNKRVAADFTRAWKKATGQVYSHVPMALTPEQLRSLPTILIQCQAFSSNSDPTIEDYNSIPGYTGSLDPTSPSDLLIAIPATSYMDYSPITRRYMSRLYFTESVGGVLGSNTMQGHNVLFDWQNGRIGFAESSCTYDKKDVPEVAQDTGFASDCIVSDPILTRSCIETVNRQLCQSNPTGIALYGNETWTAIVENPGNDAGIPCALSAPVTGTSVLNNPMEPTIICGGQGICEEFRPCLLTCPQVEKAADVKPLSITTYGKKKKRSICQDSGWSACDYGCVQTKITSIPYSDGICHEVSRDTRPCHIGACSRHDPCRVPFIVHVVLAFRHGNVSHWSKEAEETLVVAMTKVANADVAPSVSEHQKPLFTAGDVYISAALPWYQDQDEYDMTSNDAVTERDYSDQYNSVILGIKVIVEISMYNPLADDPNKVSTIDNNNDDESSNKSGFASMLRNVTYLVRGAPPQLSCSTKELYPLAQLALKTKETIRSKNFIVSLFNTIETSSHNEDRRAFGFGRITHLTDKVVEDRVGAVLLSVWTIRTGINDDDDINYFGPQKALSVRIFTIVRSMLSISMLFFIFMLFWNVLSGIYNFFMNRFQSGKSITTTKRQLLVHQRIYNNINSRNIPYTILTPVNGTSEENNNYNNHGGTNSNSATTSNPYDMEDRIIMGLGADIELSNYWGKNHINHNSNSHRSSHSNMVTKRTNRSSPTKQ